MLSVYRVNRKKKTVYVLRESKSVITESYKLYCRNSPMNVSLDHCAFGKIFLILFIREECKTRHKSTGKKNRRHPQDRTPLCRGPRNRFFFFLVETSGRENDRICFIWDH